MNYIDNVTNWCGGIDEASDIAIECRWLHGSHELWQNDLNWDLNRRQTMETMFLAVTLLCKGIVPNLSENLDRHYATLPNHLRHSTCHWSFLYSLQKFPYWMNYWIIECWKNYLKKPCDRQWNKFCYFSYVFFVISKQIQIMESYIPSNTTKLELKASFCHQNTLIFRKI